MKTYVTDTHALFWYLVGSRRLSPRAKAVFSEGDSGRARILIPIIVLAELYYLIEKLGSSLDFDEEYRKIVSVGQFEVVPLESNDILSFPDLTAVPEMHDRIIVSVAYARDVPLVSVDKDIRQSNLVEVIW